MTTAAAQQHFRAMAEASPLYASGRRSRAQIQQLINTAQAWLSRNPSASGADRGLVQAAIELGQRTLRGPGGTASTAHAGESAASQKEREAQAVLTSGGGSGSSKTPTTPDRASGSGAGASSRSGAAPASDSGPGGLPDLPLRPVGLFTAIARTFTGQGDLSTLWVPPGSGFFERPLTQLVLLVGGALTVATVVTVIVAKSESKKDEE